MGFYFLILLFFKAIWRITLDDVMKKINSILTREFQSYFKHPQINHYDYYVLPTKTSYDGFNEIDRTALNSMFDFLSRYFNSYNFMHFSDNHNGLIFIVFEIGYTHITDTISLRNTLRIETTKQYLELIEGFIADDSVYVFPFTKTQLQIAIAYNYQGRKIIQSRYTHDEKLLQTQINRGDIEE